MTQQEIIQKANHFLVEDFELDETTLTPAANLKETLDLDSLDYVDLVVAVERAFNLKIRPEDFQQMHTMGDFYSFIDQRLNG